MNHPPRQLWWELNRRCDQACLHCRTEGSATADPGLPDAELLRVADEVTALRVREVFLTGGEPTLHPGWALVAARLQRGGAAVTLCSAGPALTEATLDLASASGVAGLRVSLDGRAPTHDARRPWTEGSAHAATLAAVQRAHARGLRVEAVTVLGRDNKGELPALYDQLLELGVRSWSVQLLTAAGRARSGDLSPDLATVVAAVELLQRVATEGRLSAPLHCSIGYSTAAETLRAGGPWRGNGAGRSGLALTSMGQVLGCPCLPDAFATGSIRESSLHALWYDDGRFPYSRGWTPGLLAGRCARCEVATRCRAGCLGVAYGLTGTIGYHPLCLRP